MKIPLTKLLHPQVERLVVGGGRSSVMPGVDLRVEGALAQGLGLAKGRVIWVNRRKAEPEVSRLSLDLTVLSLLTFFGPSLGRVYRARPDPTPAYERGGRKGFMTLLRKATRCSF